MQALISELNRKEAEQEERTMLLPLFVFFLRLMSPRTASASVDALPGCQDSCGNISVPYPFGISPGCFAPGFKMSCNNSYIPPKLFIGFGNIEVTDISEDNMFIRGWVARDCYDEVNSPTHVWTELKGTPYTFSYTRNRFTAIGCDTVALIYRTNATDFTSGCMSLCHDSTNVVNGTCSGIGCCQTAIPKGLKRFDTILGSLSKHVTTQTFSPCSYAFLIDQEEFQFSVSDFYDFRTRSRVPVVLDWAVGNQTCQEAKRSGNLLCGANANCSESTNGPGYKCRCNDGYQGNPYLVDGCQDINECQDPTSSPCVDICTNTPGSYICLCSQGSSGDGRKDGSGCTTAGKSFPLVQVVLGSGLSFLFLLVTGSLLYWGLKKRRLIQLRQMFFKQNGGLLLQEQISSHNDAAETMRIFTAEELQKATDNYSRSRIIGTGGNGTVYKGILPHNIIVAIKKSKVVDENQIEQFINEVVVLSQVIHRDVVKIVGCCLETQVPLLIYEYVPNGSLSYHLRGPGNFSSLSWEARLRIAAETAGALAYLHSSTTRPIIHGDVKSANILLDENYTAKVADFGASRLVPLNRAHITTLVQGTFGYLDPEYFHTGHLTDKSDVYSFGVVIAELLTGEPPVSSQRQEPERSLAMYFMLSMERNQLSEILEPRVANEGDRAQLQDVAGVAERCLRLTGEERPMMKEVAAELERARRFGSHPWAQQDDDEETGRLLSGSPSASHADATTRNERVENLSSSTVEL